MVTLPGWNSIESATGFSRGFAIAGFVALFFVVVFDVLAYVYSNRKDALVAVANLTAAENRRHQAEEANQERNAEIAEANRKATEAQGRTEELERRTAPRVLSQTQKERISAFLAGKPVGAFIIKASVVAADGRAYADQIADLFRTAGWNVRLDNAMFSGPNITGIWITVQNGRASPTAAGILQHAFAAGGITVRGEYDPTMTDPNEIWLSIGAK